jgi:hypothetical protein
MKTAHSTDEATAANISCETLYVEPGEVVVDDGSTSESVARATSAASAGPAPSTAPCQADGDEIDNSYASRKYGFKVDRPFSSRSLAT